MSIVPKIASHLSLDLIGIHMCYSDNLMAIFPRSKDHLWIVKLFGPKGFDLIDIDRSSFAHKAECSFSLTNIIWTSFSRKKESSFSQTESDLRSLVVVLGRGSSFWEASIQPTFILGTCWAPIKKCAFFTSFLVMSPFHSFIQIVHSLLGHQTVLF